MKKLYTLALAAAVAATASAGIGTQTLSQVSGEKAIAPVKKMVAETVMLDNGISTMATTLADGNTSLASIEGSYVWEWYSYLNSNSGWQTSTCDITIADATTGAVSISLGGWEVEGSYDEATQTLTIPANQYLGYNEYNGIDVYLYHRKWTSEGSLDKGEDGSGVFDDPFEFFFDGTTFACAEIEGTGKLEGQTFDNNILAIGNVAVGWFVYGDNNTFSIQGPWVDEMPEGDWTKIGTGIFADAWQMIGFVGLSYPDYAWEVDVEQNSLNPYLYRMANPYNTTNCPILNDNFDAEGSGYIVFSVEDPDFVTVYPFIYSGLEDKMGAYLNFNIEGYYAIGGGYDKETIIAGTGIETVSTYADGMVTFENCRFATTDDPTGLYTWQDKQGNPLVGPSALLITLPKVGVSGVNEINLDENAPAEYFNLQGVRVANPAAGQLLIKVQGGQATKQIVK